jgi:hypothetical protein
MANSLGTLNAALIAQRGLELLVTDFPVIGQIVSDFSNEDVKYNQTITTRIPSVGSVQDYDTSTGYVAASALSTDVSVTLNKFKHATFELNDAEFSATNRNLIEDYAMSFSVAIGTQIMFDVASLFTVGNFASTTTCALSAATRKTVIVAPNTELNKRNVNKNRFGIFNSDLYASLMNDDSVVDLTFKGVGIGEATLPVIHGVALSEYSALPTTSNLIGVVGAKDSIVFASRVPADAGFADLPATGRISVVTEPKSGLSVHLRNHLRMCERKHCIPTTHSFSVTEKRNRNTQDQTPSQKWLGVFL